MSAVTRTGVWIVAALTAAVIVSAVPASAQAPPPPPNRSRQDAARCPGCADIPWQPDRQIRDRRGLGDSQPACGIGGRAPCPGAPIAAAGSSTGAGAGSSTGAGAGSSTGAGAGSAAPSPPRPPAAREALALCPPIDDPVIGVNPLAPGLTGLETWLWAESQQARSASGSIRGYPVWCTVTPQRWTWQTGDGGRYTRSRPGGPHPDNPAAHIYRTKRNAYTLTLTVAWLQITNYGADLTTRSTSQPYQVIEVRSTLTS